jgi:hypothetical protein
MYWISCARFLSVVASVAVLAGLAEAQTPPPDTGITPLAMAPGTPSGSWLALVATVILEVGATVNS